MLNSVCIRYLLPSAPLVTLLFPFQGPTIASHLFVFCPPSSHLAKHTDECLPEHKLPQMRAGSGQAKESFCKCFCNGSSFPSEYLDPFYTVVSRGRGECSQHCCEFCIETDESMMHEKAVRRAECWCKVGHLFLHALMWGLFSWVNQDLARQVVPL